MAVKGFSLNFVCLWLWGFLKKTVSILEITEANVYPLPLLSFVKIIIKLQLPGKASKNYILDLCHLPHLTLLDHEMRTPHASS